MSSRARFSGKNVVITGATGGIGRATLQMFAREGATVVALDLNGQLAGEVALEASRSANNKGYGFGIDVASSASVERAMHEVVKTVGRVDVLINAAGVVSLSWNGIAFTAAAETAGAGRSGAALGFQQTVLGVFITITAPTFAALVAATSWRVAFLIAAALPAFGVLALRRLPATRSGRSPGTSAIPPAIP